MIAVINSSGAILFDLTEKEADTYAKGKGLLCNETMKSSLGWIFIEKSMAYQILKFGISVCYIDINNLQSAPEGKTDYMKVSTIKFLDIWDQLYPIKERIKGEAKCY